jgi:hypothetical protein
VLWCTAQRTLWWDDGLHFTPAGYDALADVIFEATTGVLTPCGAANATAAGRALELNAVKQ